MGSARGSPSCSGWGGGRGSGRALSHLLAHGEWDGAGPLALEELDRPLGEGAPLRLDKAREHGQRARMRARLAVGLRQARLVGRVRVRRARRARVRVRVGAGLVGRRGGRRGLELARDELG